MDGNGGKHWDRVIVFAAALFLAAEAAAGTGTPGNETIIRNFDVIAFGNEYTGRRYAHVRKWRAPILVGIEGKVPRFFELTEHDRLMLKMLYDPRITVGMGRERALGLGRKILDEIQPR